MATQSSKTQFGPDSPNGYGYIPRANLDYSKDKAGRIIPGARWIEVASVRASTVQRFSTAHKHYRSPQVVLRVQARAFDSGSQYWAIQFRWHPLDVESSRSAEIDIDTTNPPLPNVDHGNFSSCGDFSQKGWEWGGPLGVFKDRTDFHFGPWTRALAIRNVFLHVFGDEDYA